MIHFIPYPIARFFHRPHALKIALPSCIALDKIYYTLDESPSTEKPGDDRCHDKEMV